MKWRRGEEQLTEAQTELMSSMIHEGYTVSGCMDRFGLTHPTQVRKGYRQPKKTRVVPGDKTPFNLSLRTTFDEVFRDYLGCRRG